MKKGQTVLEFLFLILIITIYLTQTIIPMSAHAQSAISDTEKVSRANNETQKIANAIQKVSLQSTDSRQTVDVFVPADTIIKCNDASDYISFDTNLSLTPFPAQCLNGICTKSFPASPATIDCSSFFGIIGPIKTSVLVSKNLSKVSLTVTGS